MKNNFENSEEFNNLFRTERSKFEVEENFKIAGWTLDMLVKEHGITSEMSREELKKIIEGKLKELNDTLLVTKEASESDAVEKESKEFKEIVREERVKTEREIRYLQTLKTVMEYSIVDDKKSNIRELKAWLVKRPEDIEESINKDENLKRQTEK
jgi:hypothetical protein